MRREVEALAIDVASIQPEESLHDLPGHSGIFLSAVMSRKEMRRRYTAATGFGNAGLRFCLALAMCRRW